MLFRSLQTQLARTRPQPVPGSIPSPPPAPETPRLWLQPSSLSSLVSAFCVPLRTPGPKDPDLGWETDPPGERLTTAQLSGVPAGRDWASAGLFPSVGPVSPGTCGTPPWVLPACLSQGASAPVLGLGTRQPSPGPWWLPPPPLLSD